MIFGFPSMLSDAGGGINPTGVFSTSSSPSSLVVPAGVTSIAAALLANGGAGANDSIPELQHAGGGGGWASSDNIVVTPGQILQIVSEPVLVSGQIVIQYTLRFRPEEGGTILLVSRGGGNGSFGDGAGVAGQAVTGPLRVFGQAGSIGTEGNRGGSSGAAGGMIPNPNNVSSGYGVTHDTLEWDYVPSAGYGRGAAGGNPPLPAGQFRLIVVWGPGKGFSAGPGSFWPFV